MTLPVLFGANVDPSHADPTAPLRAAERIERAGLDLVTIQDHPYRPGFYDTWTLLTYLAARTNRVTFVPTVANLPLRPPAVLAKSAASLDVLTGGRLRLGLGAGAFWDQIVAMGGPRRAGLDRIRALDEAIDVIRALWSDARSVRAGGEFYRVRDVEPGPRPGGELAIWLGANGPRMLDLLGAKADGWQPSLLHLGLDDLPAASARVDAAAERAGRVPGSIRKVYNITGLVGPESPRPFRGSAAQWVDQLAVLVGRHGMNGFVFWPESDFDRQVERFAAEVVPAARAALT
ncbi:LLM class flavin-dependent oxidoreductase [Actinophytocola sp.]|uniref:LLM class flavin-dependent oxidoreductase n=1 Tax=Actinophytocola sp. TaxID=1872138 RepID=UPI002D282A26|nr:LLM class flavin-dependent oxidoreductase [Actinophytocola sp.]HYQ63128.1 LLM class flavin-dependent oxidoreductase [Actinophytocola sp.]